MPQGEGQGAQPPPAEQSRRVTRRRFLQGGAALLVGAAANATPSDVNVVASILTALPDPQPSPAFHTSPVPENQAVAPVSTPQPLELHSVSDTEQTKTAEELQQQIESEFNILLKRTPLFKKTGEGKMREVNVEVEEPRDPRETPWTVPQLKMLLKFLRKYPKSFLAPNEEDGTKMNIFLVEKPSDTSGKAYTRTDTSNELQGKTHANLTNFVAMSTDVFNPEKPEQAWFILSHELTHKIEPVTVSHADSYIGTVPFEVIKTQSLWREKLKEAFGADEFRMRQMLQNRVLMQYTDVFTNRQSLMQPELWEKGNDRFTEDEQKSFFARRMLYAAGLSPEGEELNRGAGDLNLYPAEFYGVLAETYVFGYDHFRQMYGDYFESDVVDRLYAFTRDTIFEERQYRRNGKEIEYFDKAA